MDGVKYKISKSQEGAVRMMKKFYFYFFYFIKGCPLSVNADG